MPLVCDLRWHRFEPLGEGHGFHRYCPSLTPGTQHVVRSGIPLGHLKPADASLVVVENS
jgi:hypothetical protein